MNNTSAEKSPETTPSRVSMPAPSLSRAQLTTALVTVTIVPFLLVVLLYVTLPGGADPVLNAEVTVGPQAWPSENAPDARLVPSVVLRNPTQEDWNNVNLSVNKQFHFYHPDIIRPGEQVVIPLKFFHTKGNQFYPPESQPLNLLTIYAQVPSGARAIVEIPGKDL